MRYLLIQKGAFCQFSANYGARLGGKNIFISQFIKAIDGIFDPAHHCQESVLFKIAASYQNGSGKTQFNLKGAPENNSKPSRSPEWCSNKDIWGKAIL